MRTRATGRPAARRCTASMIPSQRPNSCMISSVFVSVDRQWHRDRDMHIRFDTDRTQKSTIWGNVKIRLMEYDHSQRSTGLLFDHDLERFLDTVQFKLALHQVTGPC